MSQDHYRDGFGPGLFIVREIVTAHSGTLTVDGDVEPGAAFVLRLPLNADQSS